jgi:hypothetical protein
MNTPVAPQSLAAIKLNPADPAGRLLRRHMAEAHSRSDIDQVNPGPGNRSAWWPTVARTTSTLL